MTPVLEWQFFIEELDLILVQDGQRYRSIDDPGTNTPASESAAIPLRQSDPIEKELVQCLEAGRFDHVMIKPCLERPLAIFLLTVSG
jgi:hypothetical protein